MSTPARVRVAPSPTGDPHVGTAYMALFNKAMADTTGGKFILRIEDTDRARYVADSERQIFEALDWLGLAPHEGPPEHGPGGPFGPYRQSERLPSYREAAEVLLRTDHAYRCYCTEDRLATLRKIQQAEKTKLQGYDGLCRSLTPEQISANEAVKKPGVVRFKLRREGDIEVQDFFRGTLKFIGAEQQDAVLLKSDGFPTYHLANIVDDHAMRITHVIRAEEWIPSLPLHFELYRAFGWQPPVFAHMPLLRNKDKSKISKRKNPTSLLWYRDAGFLPEGLRNFLGLMGFSLPNDQEIFTYEEFLKHFDLAKVNTGGPIFDLQKLHWLNGEWMRRLSDADLEARLLAYVKHLQGREFPDQPEADQPTETFLRDFEQKRRRWSRTLAALAPTILERHAKEPGLLARVIPLIKERLHTLAEAADYVPMFYTSDFKLTREALVPKKQTPEGAATALREMRAIIEATDFSAPDAKEMLDAAARTKAEALGQKIGVFLAPVRVAVTGSSVSPPLFDSLHILGKPETLSRIDSSLKIASATARPIDSKTER